jgi:hypothetical protein
MRFDAAAIGPGYRHGALFLDSQEGVNVLRGKNLAAVPPWRSNG